MTIDWKLKLMQILECVSDCEGMVFDHYWDSYGVTDDEHAVIMKEYREYLGMQKDD
jgi:hypothetical protein